jgi:hypothetical protein
VKSLHWLPHRVIVIDVKVLIFLRDGIVESLKADLVIDLIHLLIVVEKVLMLSSLVDAQISRLCPVDIVSHEPPFNSLLQNHFR